MTDFCHVTGNEYLCLDSIVRLFDRDRRPSFGERSFMPRELWNQVHAPLDKIRPDSTLPSAVQPQAHQEGV